MNKRRAIILFLRDEQEEGLLKPLPQGYAAGGYQQLNRSIAKRLISTDSSTTDVIVVGSKPIKGLTILAQHGAEFGERITNAFCDVFALGYDQAVMVGNDCPTITCNEIADAFTALEQGFAVAAAPAYDGGAYIIGLAADGFHPTIFAKLPWQTETLFAALQALPAATAVGPIRADFDDWNTTDAYHALQQLIGFTSRIIPSSPIQPYSLFSHSTWMAIARPHLPAPPFR